jgi:hypothetical protein
MNLSFGKTSLQPAIRGKIGDPQEFPIAQARIVLSGSHLSEKMTAVTGMEGSFMFSRVPPGVYTLEINYSGFRKLVQRGIAVHEHAITGLDLKMDFLEDSRALKLRALSLEYINDLPTAEYDETPSHLERQIQDVMDELHLDRALFNPPAAVKVGRPVTVEIGVYQNLREEIMRRLLERKISRYDGVQIDAVLRADLQVSGCRVLPKSLPQVGISGAGYLEWQWEVLPRISGLGLVRLSLQARVNFADQGEYKQCLLVLDRELRIKRNVWLELRRFLSKAGVAGEMPWIS